ncbi:unnamed protein product [Urochloa humidicola]
MTVRSAQLLSACGHGLAAAGVRARTLACFAAARSPYPGRSAAAHCHAPAGTPPRGAPRPACHRAETLPRPARRRALLCSGPNAAAHSLYPAVGGVPRCPDRPMPAGPSDGPWVGAAAHSRPRRVEPLPAPGEAPADATAPAAAAPVPDLTLSSPAIDAVCLTAAPSATSSAVTDGGSAAPYLHHHHQQAQQRKARRCWSPELHRRFVAALHRLGGVQVATPK